MKYSRELKSGVVILIAILALYWGINFLKGNDVFSKSRKFYAVYPKVEGLVKSQPVFINGYQVGAVENIYFHPNMNGELIVVISMHTDYPIAKNTVARISSTDLLGGKAIELVPGNSLVMAQPGDTLVPDITLSLSEEVNMQVLPLKNKVEKLLGSVDTILVLATEIISEDFRENINSSVSSLRNTFASIEKSAKSFEGIMTENEEAIGQTVEDVNEVSDILQKNKMNLDRIIKNLTAISDSLIESNPGEAFRSLKNTLVNVDGVLSKIEHGEGNLGLLLKDDQLYKNLEIAAERLNLLLLDMQLNPKRYVQISVFGRSKEYDAEELRRIHEEDKENFKSN